MLHIALVYGWGALSRKDRLQRWAMQGSFTPPPYPPVLNPLYTAFTITPAAYPTLLNPLYILDFTITPPLRLNPLYSTLHLPLQCAHHCSTCHNPNLNSTLQGTHYCSTRYTPHSHPLFQCIQHCSTHRYIYPFNVPTTATAIHTSQ